MTTSKVGALVGWLVASLLSDKSTDCARMCLERSVYYIFLGGRNGDTIWLPTQARNMVPIFQYKRIVVDNMPNKIFTNQRFIWIWSHNFLKKLGHLGHWSVRKIGTLKFVCKTIHNKSRTIHFFILFLIRLAIIFLANFIIFRSQIFKYINVKWYEYHLIKSQIVVLCFSTRFLMR